jgi:hypothetical protein
VFFNGVTIRLLSKYLPTCKLEWKSNGTLLTFQAAVLLLGMCYSSLVLYYITSITENTPDAVSRCAILNKLLGVVHFSCNFFIYQFLLLRAKAVEVSKWQKWFGKGLFAFIFLELILIVWYGIEVKPLMILLGDGVTYTCGAEISSAVTFFYGFFDIVMNIGCLVLFVLPLRELMNYRKKNGSQDESFSTIITRNFRSSVMCVVINICLLVNISINDDISLAFTFVHGAYSTVSGIACLYATSFAWERQSSGAYSNFKQVTGSNNMSKA